VQHLLTNNNNYYLIQVKKKKKQNTKKTIKNTAKVALFTSLSGWVADMLMYPLDTVTVRMASN
jgi:hypothetical protein